MRTPALLASACGLLLATACGTTVPLAQQSGPPGAGAPTGSGQDGLTPVAPGPGTAPVQGGTGTAGGPPVAAPGGVRAPAQGVGQGPVVAAPGEVGPGVTATTINVGLSYSVNGREALAAFGATGEGVGGGDGKAIWDAVIGDINAKGGILGRKVVPVYHVFDATSTQPYDSLQQQACANWTDDHKVLFVAQPPSAALSACLLRAGVAQSSAVPTDASTAFYKAYPNVIEAGTLQMDRVAAALPAQLQRLGWFSRWDTATGSAGGVQPTKVGIVAFDDNDTKKAVGRLLAPAISRITGTETDVVHVLTPQSAGDNAAAIAAIQSAVLRFRQSGVTHLVPFETMGAGIAVFFGQNAERQGYRPRYGLTSGNAAQLYLDQGLLPAGQVRGALGMGWQPMLDLTNADNPDSGPWSNDARRACLAVMKAKKIDTTAAIIKRQALESCTSLWFLRAALTRSASPTLAGFVRGAEALGRSFTSGLTFGTAYDALHHDGAALWRSFAFRPACGCFRYDARLTRIP